MIGRIQPPQPAQPRTTMPRPTGLGDKSGNAYGTDQAGFNPYQAGARRYGAAGVSSAPTAGRVDRSGYAVRDAAAAARKDALVQRLRTGRL